jgi:hypothetical protein
LTLAASDLSGKPRPANARRLWRHRLEQAALLLRESTRRISEIAERLGYSKLYYLSASSPSLRGQPAAMAANRPMIGLESGHPRGYS